MIKSHCAICKFIVSSAKSYKQEPLSWAAWVGTGLNQHGQSWVWTLGPAEGNTCLSTTRNSFFPSAFKEATLTLCAEMDSLLRECEVWILITRALLSGQGNPSLISLTNKIDWVTGLQKTNSQAPGKATKPGVLDCLLSGCSLSKPWFVLFTSLF